MRKNGPGSQQKPVLDQILETEIQNFNLEVPSNRDGIERKHRTRFADLDPNFEKDRIRSNNKKKNLSKITAEFFLGYIGIRFFLDGRIRIRSLFIGCRIMISYFSRVGFLFAS